MMQIDIQARGFTLTESLRRHAERRLQFAIGSMHDNLRAIAMRLSDENGPRGGDDKRCRIQASLTGTSPVVIEDIQSNLYAAIDRASDRLGRTVARRLQRQRRERRFSGRAELAAISGNTESEN